MNTISRTLSGIGAIAVGLFVLYAMIGEGVGGFEFFWGSAWALVFIGVGVYLLFNKKEDDIEEIKGNDKDT